MADTDNKNSIYEKAEEAFKEIDDAVADNASEAAAEAASSTETDQTVVDLMAGALGKDLSLPEGNEAEAAASEKSAKGAVPEAGKTSVEGKTGENSEAKEARKDEVPADEGD